MHRDTYNILKRRTIAVRYTPPSQQPPSGVALEEQRRRAADEESADDTESANPDQSNQP